MSETRKQAIRDVAEAFRCEPELVEGSIDGEHFFNEWVRYAVEQRQKVLELKTVLQVVLDSASPNPRDHPTMTPAWEVGRAALEPKKEVSK